MELVYISVTIRLHNPQLLANVKAYKIYVKYNPLPLLFFFIRSSKYFALQLAVHLHYQKCIWLSN